MPLQPGAGAEIDTVPTVTVRVTSSVLSGQGGLLTVRRRVAAPVPVTVTPEVRLLGLAIAAEPLTTDQVGVPMAATPARVNEVVASAEHLASSGPAFAVGF